MPQWEYKIVELSGGGLFGGGEEPTEASLNELGGDGWELVDTVDYVGGGTKYLVLKRPAEGDGSEGNG